jgi:hypothetical protein
LPTSLALGRRSPVDRLDHRRFRSRAEARIAVLVLIAGRCKPRRRHSALGHPSPADDETCRPTQG